MNTESKFDFVTILLKMDLPEEHVMTVNNLWLRVGLTRVLLGGRYYRLRELESL